ncbi:hypothetical protein Pyrfu_1014 [Pyrolobus fumarii 1A]|uniref:Uncharacterized protein n=1 Tax=Pyrolobus fumarii (strain DSM 11204 / 1A) TaxID=694429 RepID=G0EER0_PYRF1|nr:hypothetical protein [Pyrolobus fumarii]AEM38882.1 hypothetical protein Pyrfu_1014 [Pyrolobus fumarii 1A]
MQGAHSALAPENTIEVNAYALYNNGYGRVDASAKAYDSTDEVMVMIYARFDDTPVYCAIDFGQGYAYAYIDSKEAGIENVKYTYAEAEGENYNTGETVFVSAFASQSSGWCGC